MSRCVARVDCGWGTAFAHHEDAYVNPHNLHLCYQNAPSKCNVLNPLPKSKALVSPAVFDHVFAEQCTRPRFRSPPWCRSSTPVPCGVKDTNDRIRLLVVTLHPLCDITCDMVCWKIRVDRFQNNLMRHYTARPMHASQG